MYIKTPLIQSIPLIQLTGRSIWLKMESSQPVGSFKLRGLSTLCTYLTQQGVNHLVSSSGGNAGYTVSYIGKTNRLKTTVFVPTITPSLYIEAMQSLDAEVIKVGEVWDETNQVALAFAKEKPTRGFIPPFDHPKIWQGHSSIIDEIIQDGVKPSAIITSVGGAGLLCGLLEGLHRHNYHDVVVYGVETEGAASFHETLKAKKLITLTKLNTVAKTLAAKTVTKKVLDWLDVFDLRSILVSDNQAVSACYQFANDHRVLTEPACGAALASLYYQLIDLNEHDVIIVIACGGIGVNVDLLHNKFKY